MKPKINIKHLKKHLKNTTFDTKHIETNHKNINPHTLKS